MNTGIIVLGAGLQGSCIALELANRGFDVQLMDQDSTPFNRASIRNEGKIHLGLVYANDISFATPKLMLKGSLCFSGNLSRWIGKAVNDLNVSSPFYYLVAKDSFLNPSELEIKYDKLQEIYDLEKDVYADLDYIGTKPQTLAKRCSEEEISTYFNPNELQGAFRTAELAIDTEKLAYYIRKAIHNHAKISFLADHKVTSIYRNGSKYEVKGINSRGKWKMRSDQVINATWTDKFRLDETAGIPAPAGILHRLKYRVIAQIPPEMAHYPSATMVIGRFGDVVIKPDATAYLSWYPDACTGWSDEIQPPKLWDDACKGIVSKKDFKRLSEQFITNIQRWYPSIKKCIPKIVDAGAIVAFGNSDVDDINSELHERSRLGVKSYDGYHSVQTGKLTMAPLIAMETADNVEYRMMSLASGI